jgi:hypothetical protein
MYFFHNIFIWITAITIFSWQCAKVYESSWQMPEEKKKLAKYFEQWWLNVAYLDRLKFALACAAKVEGILTSIFGNDLFSKRTFKRCFFVSNVFLVSSLAVVGFINHKPFGITPWQNYLASGNFLLAVGDGMMQQARTMKPIKHQDSTMLEIVSTNRSVAAINNTNLEVVSTNEITPEMQVSNAVVKIHQTVAKYTTVPYSILFSIIFFSILLFCNTVLFFFSLVFCRMIIREIVVVGRTLSTFSLLITNLFITFNFASTILLFLLIVENPVGWVWVPIFLLIAQHSLVGSGVTFSFSETMAWLISDAALRLTVLIAFLPSVFALLVTLLSFITLRWRNGIHRCVTALLLRCESKGPFVVIAGIIALISALLGLFSKLISSN